MNPLRLCIAALLLGCWTTLAWAGKPEVKPEQTLDLWPGQAPGEKGDIGPEESQKAKPENSQIARVTKVSKPTIAVYPAPSDKHTGAAVIVAPGGGYSMLAIGHEGEDVAVWLNSVGVTAVVLKYRVPQRPDQQPKNLAAAQDAQRAMRLVRSKAADWKIDAHRIGMLGFSAGGHLTVCTSINDQQNLYDAVDDADKLSSKPDFAVVIYPGGLLEKDGQTLQSDYQATKETPPTFLAQAGDDKVNSENSVQWYLALKHAGVPAELHIYATGGHGFGLRPSDNPSSTWPQRCAEWMTARGVHKAKGAE